MNGRIDRMRPSTESESTRPSDSMRIRERLSLNPSIRCGATWNFPSSILAFSRCSLRFSSFRSIYSGPSRTPFQAYNCCLEEETGVMNHANPVVYLDLQPSLAQVLQTLGQIAVVHTPDLQRRMSDGGAAMGSFAAIGDRLCMHPTSYRTEAACLYRIRHLVRLHGQPLPQPGPYDGAAFLYHLAPPRKCSTGPCGHPPP